MSLLIIGTVREAKQFAVHLRLKDYVVIDHAEQLFGFHEAQFVRTNGWRQLSDWPQISQLLDLFNFRELKVL